MNPISNTLAPYKPGSLAAIASNDPKKMLQAIRNAKALVLCDVSGSMDTPDAGDTSDRRRCDVLQDVLNKVQADIPGGVLLYAFNSEGHGIVPSGQLPPPAGGTPIFDALNAIYRISATTKQKLILLTDGEPTPVEQEQMCISLAEQVQYPIDCIYVGPKGDPHGGQRFLRELAEASGGSMEEISLDRPLLLADVIRGLLQAKNGG